MRKRFIFSYFSPCVAVVESLFEILLDAVGSAVEAFDIILLEILFDIVSFDGLLRVSLQLLCVYKSFLLRIISVYVYL